MGNGSKNRGKGSKGLYFYHSIMGSIGLASACPAVCRAASDEVASTGEILSLVVSLVLILGAAAAAAWLLRRWQGSLGRREGPLRLEHIIAVGPRERLAMVRAGTRWLVVGITPTVVTRIAELQEGEQEAPKPVSGNVGDPVGGDTSGTAGATAAESPPPPARTASP